MATTHSVSVEEYLHTSFEHDAEYVEGRIVWPCSFQKARFPAVDAVPWERWGWKIWQMSDRERSFCPRVQKSQGALDRSAFDIFAANPGLNALRATCASKYCSLPAEETTWSRRTGKPQRSRHCNKSATIRISK